MRVINGEGDVRSDGMHCPCGCEHFQLRDGDRPGVLTIGSRGEVTSWTGGLICDACGQSYEIAARPTLVVAEDR